MNGQQVCLKTVDELRVDSNSNTPLKFWVPAYQCGYRSLIFNYLYDEQTGLPVDVYSPEDVNTLAEELFKHVYVQYPDAVENVYNQ